MSSSDSHIKSDKDQHRQRKLEHKHRKAKHRLQKSQYKKQISYVNQNLKIIGLHKPNKVINRFDRAFKGFSIVASETLIGLQALSYKGYGTGQEYYQRVKDTLPYRRALTVHYVERVNPWKGITLITDDYLKLKKIKQIKSKYKVALLLEPRSLKGKSYHFIEQYISLFDVILTYDQQLIKQFPSRTILYHPTCPTIEWSSIKIHPKSKLVSFLYSDKKFLQGHRLRHQIVEHILPKVDITVDQFTQFDPIKSKSETLNDYMFSFAIQNCADSWYFSDILLDCLATGTVPIFWGCPDIGRFFNLKGMLIIQDLNSVKQLLDQLSPELYQSMLPYVRLNFNQVQQYLHPDELIYQKVTQFISSRKEQ